VWVSVERVFLLRPSANGSATTRLRCSLDVIRASYFDVQALVLSC
jgi:hypothetical protein